MFVDKSNTYVTIIAVVNVLSGGFFPCQSPSNTKMRMEEVLMRNGLMTSTLPQRQR